MAETELKQAIKEALKEWMDTKYQEFGKWTVRTLLSVAFFGLMYLFFSTNGWHLPHG